MSTITISTRTLLEVLLGGVVIGLSAWVFTGTRPTPSGSPPGALEPAPTSKSKSKKKRQQHSSQPARADPTPAKAAPSPAAPQPAQAPNPAPAPVASSAEPQKKNKSSKTGLAAAAPAAGPTTAPTKPAGGSPSGPSFAAIAAPGPTPVPTPASPSLSISTSASNSKVRSKSPSSRSPVIKANNKMRPQGSPTADMIDKDDAPAPAARVMRVMGGKLGALPPVGEWDDWHSREDEDNGWEVATKAKSQDHTPSHATRPSLHYFARLTTLPQSPQNHPSRHCPRLATLPRSLRPTLPQRRARSPA